MFVSFLYADNIKKKNTLVLSNAKSSTLILIFIRRTQQPHCPLIGRIAVAKIKGGEECAPVSENMVSTLNADWSKG